MNLSFSERLENKALLENGMLWGKKPISFSILLSIAFYCWNIFLNTISSGSGDDFCLTSSYSFFILNSINNYDITVAFLIPFPIVLVPRIETSSHISRLSASRQPSHSLSSFCEISSLCLPSLACTSQFYYIRIHYWSKSYSTIWLSIMACS